MVLIMSETAPTSPSRVDLDSERRSLDDPAVLQRSGRNARTLLKSGPLRVTIVTVAPGGEVARHQAPGPITVQVLHGEIVFRVAGEDHRLRAGMLLAVPPGMEHSVSSGPGGTFLLTVVHPGA
jgi:quercetin dioxygenase-like cupin family protein